MLQSTISSGLVFRNETKYIEQFWYKTLMIVLQDQQIQQHKYLGIFYSVNPVSVISLAYNFRLKFGYVSSFVSSRSLIIGCVPLDSAMQHSGVWDWTPWLSSLESLSASLFSSEDGSKSTIFRFDHLSGCNGSYEKITFMFDFVPNLRSFNGHH